MKIDKLNCCVKPTLSIFHDFNDIAIVVFWYKLASTKKRNVETIARTSFSLKLFVLHIITKTLRFYNYIQFSQASITRNTTLVKISLPEFQTFPRVEGMSEIHSKISLHRFSLFRCQSIKITWLLTIFIHWLLHDVTTPGTNTDVERAAGLNREKLDTQNQKILNLVLKRR